MQDRYSVENLAAIGATVADFTRFSGMAHSTLKKIIEKDPSVKASTVSRANELFVKFKRTWDVKPKRRSA